MVVDKYTQRLLSRFGWEFVEYDDIKEFLSRGIEENLDKIEKLYSKSLSLNFVYARFHGKIVEYSKEHPKKRKS